MEPLVSIVIPVYNVENFLADTMESVINQTYKNLEIICVDDGSSDNSLSVLNFYSEKDKRIRVITQKNSGVSAARNHGIKEAKGKYICFLDSDDFMHPQNVELQVQALIEKDLDIVCCEFKAVPEDAKFALSSGLKSASIQVSETPLNSFMFKKMPIDSSSCNKLYKTELVAQNLFKLGIARGEDEIFVMNLLTKIKRIGATRQVLVYFRNRGGSLTKQNISETYLFDHYISFVSMAEILSQPEQLQNNHLSQRQISSYLAKKIFKRFVVHVLRKNKNAQLQERLVEISNDYLGKLIKQGILKPSALPLSRRFCLRLFRQKKSLKLVKTICKF